MTKAHHTLVRDICGDKDVNRIGIEYNDFTIWHERPFDASAIIEDIDASSDLVVLRCMYQEGDKTWPLARFRIIPHGVGDEETVVDWGISEFADHYGNKVAGTE